MATTDRSSSFDRGARENARRGAVRPSRGVVEPLAPHSSEGVGETIDDGWHSSRTRHTALGERLGASASANYTIIAGAGCVAFFFVLWWLLRVGGDDTPWLPSGLIASITMIGFVVGREIVVRRYETRSVLRRRRRRNVAREAKTRLGRTVAASAPLGALRTLERRLNELDNRHTSAAQHLDAYRECDQYLAQVAGTLSRTTLEADVRAALRAGTERISVMRKRHMLEWARKESRQITARAQRHTLVSEKIGTAEEALGVLDEALRFYPDAAELVASAAAVREFIASVHVTHWVELAKREAFKGHYDKAIDLYQDALFDLARADINEERRREVAERITREVQLLHARRTTNAALDDGTHPDVNVIDARQL